MLARERLALWRGISAFIFQGEYIPISEALLTSAQSNNLCL